MKWRKGAVIAVVLMMCILSVNAQITIDGVVRDAESLKATSLINTLIINILCILEAN